MGRKRTKSGKIRLAEVAELAGVSPITASRFFRNPEALSVAKRTRVESAARELGYVPNLAARALASQRTEVIGVLIPSLTNNVFSDVLRGIYDASESSHYSIQLSNTRYSILQEEKLLRLFLAQKPAGLIVTGIDQTTESRAMLEAADCPIVQIMEIGPNPVDMMIGFSHYEAARAAIAHLFAQGHRRIGFLGARMDPRVQRRLDGYVAAMKDAGLFDQRLIVTTATPTSVTLGGALFADLLAREPGIELGVLRQRRPRARRAVRMPAPGHRGPRADRDRRLQRPRIHGLLGADADERADQPLRDGQHCCRDADRGDRGQASRRARARSRLSGDRAAEFADAARRSEPPRAGMGASRTK